MTTETALREAFEDLTSDPPAFHATAEDLLPLGRRASRRRTLRLAAVSVPVVAGLSVIGVIGAASLVGSHSTGNNQTTVQSASGNAPAKAAAITGGTAPDQAVEKAVKAASPSGFRFAIHPLTSPVEQEFGVDGSADAGQGPGRLYVVVDPQLGSLQHTPCTDPEFVEGGSCTSTVLPDGNTLVLRGETGTTYTQVMAVVIHPDGTGVTAESDNGTFAPVTGALSMHRLAKLKRDGIGMEHITQANPPYTVAQLGQVAEAADTAASQCIAAHCAGS
jgi:hypothetical protein